MREYAACVSGRILDACEDMREGGGTVTEMP